MTVCVCVCVCVCARSIQAFMSENTSGISKRVQFGEELRIAKRT